MALKRHLLADFLFRSSSLCFHPFVYFVFEDCVSSCSDVHINISCECIFLWAKNTEENACLPLNENKKKELLFLRFCRCFVIFIRFILTFFHCSSSKAYTYVHCTDKTISSNFPTIRWNNQNERVHVSMPEAKWARVRSFSLISLLFSCVNLISREQSIRQRRKKKKINGTKVTIYLVAVFRLRQIFVKTAMTET